MQTEYRLLYRYLNSATNTAITDEADYEKTEEFYTKNHKVNTTADYLTKTLGTKYGLRYAEAGSGLSAQDYANQLNKEGNEEREELITSNMANENKSNNLFIYTGTKKYFHKKFIPEQLGYVVRDWTKVPETQIPSGPDDFSKHFVMRGGLQLGIDDAYLVCKPQFLSLYENVYKFTISTTYNQSTDYYDNSKYDGRNVLLPNITEIVNNKNWFKWNNPYDTTINAEYQESVPFKKPNLETENNSGIQMLQTKSTSSGGSTTNKRYLIIYDNESLTFANPPITSNGKLYGERGYVVNSSGNPQNAGVEWDAFDRLINNTFYQTDDEHDRVWVAQSVSFDKNVIIRDIIPEHYEETGEPPYIIKDEYDKIPFSPWMLHSIHHSLESGLELAKKLVSMIGVENVKLIKYVPIDQFVKIK